MAAANVFSNASGLFTQAYADSIKELVPETATLLRKIPFSQRAKLGDEFNCPVQLSREFGWTFNSDGSAFTLNSPIASVEKNAKVKGSEIMLPTRMSYKYMAAAGGGVKQFLQASKRKVAMNARDMGYILEVGMLHGQSDTGIGVSTAVATTSSSTGTVTISAATWAPGLWKGSTNMPFDLYATAGATNPTNANGNCVVTSVNYSTRVVTFSFNASDAASIAALGANVVLYRAGAKSGATTFKESAGIDKIITNTATLFNIDAATYDLWKGQSYSCGTAALTMGKIQAGLSEAVNSGLEDDVLLICSPKTWSNVMTDLSALRDVQKADVGKGDLENGATGIRFWTQSGLIEFLPHPYCKEGEAFAFPVGAFSRVGSTDVTLRVPGDDGDVLYKLESSAAYEFRSYTDQAAFCDQPSACVKFTNIVNT